MTVGIGAICTDGAVLMSDRQITKQGGLKFYQRKTWACGGAGYHVASVYAGIPEMAKAFQLEFKRLLPSDPYLWKPAANDLYDALESCLKQVWKKHRQNMQLEMLLCSWVQGSDYQLWRSNGKVLIPAELECIGVGDSSVIRYLFDKFTWRHRWLDLQFLVPFGIYVMHQAKEYIEGCGGRTDCIVFRKDGIHYLNDQKPIKDAEEQMESLEGEIVNLFENYSDSKMSQEKFAKMMEKFVTRIERARHLGILNRLIP